MTAPRDKARQRVSDEHLATMIAEAEAAGCYIQDAAIDLPALDLALDLRDARATLAAVTADANAAITKLQRELETMRRERDERPVL